MRGESAAGGANLQGDADQATQPETAIHQHDILHQRDRRHPTDPLEGVPSEKEGLIAVRPAEAEAPQIEETPPESRHGACGAPRGRFGPQAKTAELGAVVRHRPAHRRAPTIGEPAVGVDKEDQVHVRAGGPRPAIELDAAAGRAVDQHHLGKVPGNDFAGRVGTAAVHDDDGDAGLVTHRGQAGRDRPLLVEGRDHDGDVRLNRIGDHEVFVSKGTAPGPPTGDRREPDQS